MAQGRFAIKVDSSEVARLAERLGEVDSEVLGKAVVTAINEAADNADDLAKQQMLFGINLSEQYVDRKMKRTPATVQNPVAEIRAPRGKDYTTNLSHYDPQQMVVPVTWSNERIAGIIARKGGKFGKWVDGDWTRRVGRPSVGVPVDTKGNGKKVEVTRGQRKRVATAFSYPGVTDTEGNLLLFQRSKFTKKAKKLLGPSVYQLFRIAAEAIEADVYDDLGDRLRIEVDRVLSKVFE